MFPSSKYVIFLGGGGAWFPSNIFNFESLGDIFIFVFIKHSCIHIYFEKSVKLDVGLGHIDPSVTFELKLCFK